MWLVYVLVVVCAILVGLLRWWLGRRTAGDIVGFALVAVLLVVAQAARVVDTGSLTPSRPAAVVLLTALAVWLLNPPARVMSVLGWIGVSVAASSLVLAATSPIAWIDPSDWGAPTKAVYGSNLLAGFYSHENTLGMMLVLALPFVWHAISGRVSAIVTAVMALALLLTASRTSLIALVALCVATIAAMVVGPRLGRWLMVLATFSAFAASVVVPRLVGDAAFSERGTIWALAGEAWSSAPWLGQGPYAFSRDTSLSETLETTMGYVINHGHNSYITVRTEVGFLGAAAALALFVHLLRKCARQFTADPAPLRFLLVIAVLGVLETPVRFDTVMEQSWIAWGGILMVACRSFGVSGATSRGSSLDPDETAPPLDRPRNDAGATAPH
ncbi:putative O-antigen ligase-like protein [metagenome]|uniref:Putative O-antigen ligase-like protein n=1 Tax=metagenome TaxID=256318 RepID=A0A2P2C6L5_9ZZZZ